MKSESKSFLTGMSNPINRNLVLILFGGLLTAVVLVTAVAMLINQL